MNDFIKIGEQKIRIEQTELGEFLSITDLAKLINKNSGKVINSWIKSVHALEYLNEWELLYNPNYKSKGYQEIRMQAGSRSFFLSTKQWLKRTDAIGIKLTFGRNGSTFAHHLIALEFCAALNPRFRINVFREFLELKKNEAANLLKANELYLKKIEDNSLENNRLAKDIQDNLKKLE